MRAPVTLQEVRRHPDVQTYLAMAGRNMQLIGYTEHGLRHAARTAKYARRILLELGFSEREAELAAIAGYLHDIGNSVNRDFHPQVAVTIAFTLLRSMGMPASELGEVLCGIANHDESVGDPFGLTAAAVILADKSDVNRDRVTNTEPATFDEHDRINYAAIWSKLRVDKENRVVTLELRIDSKLGSVMEYFELFLQRMVLCRRAATTLNATFSLVINRAKLI